MTLRVVRLNRVTPSSSSRRVTAMLSAGWAICRCCAALVKLPWRTISTQQRNALRFIVGTTNPRSCIYNEV